MDRLRFDSTDLEATEEFLSSAYTRMRIGARAENTAVRIDRKSIDTLSFDELSFGYDMAYDAGCLNRVCLISIQEGTLVDRTGGTEEVFGPGDTFLIAPPDRPYQGQVRAARYTVTMFDPVVLDRVAGGGSRARAVRLTGSRAVSPEANRYLSAAVARLRDDVVDHPWASSSELVVATAVQHLAAITLAAIPNTARPAPGAPRPVDRDGAGSATLRRATSFIDDNAHRDIALADIAAAAHVTPRALQYAFRRHIGSIPLAYLRRVRLAHAHAELRRSDPGQGATVTDIALRWGFAHQGRFAAAYRRLYGVAPSWTLGR